MLWICFIDMCQSDLYTVGMYRGFFSKKKDLKFSDKEREVLLDFVDRELENIKMFGPAEDSYQKNIDSLKTKLS